jgi:protease I
MTQPTRDLEGRRVLAVIAPEKFRDEELLDPRAVLEARGAAVVVASTKAGTARGMLGAKVTPETTIEQCRAADFDAVLVVGGMGSPAHLWEHAGLHALLRETVAAGRVASSICLSGAVLAKAGILRGRRATVYETDGSLEALKAGGAVYTASAVEVDGRIVTANGPHAAKDFGRAVGDAVAALPLAPKGAAVPAAR